MKLSRLLAFSLFAVAGCGGSTPTPWVEEGEVRWRDVQPSSGGLGAFGRSTRIFRPENGSGIDFSNQLDREISLGREHLLVGSGVAIGDVDADGLPDVYLARLEGSNALYRNLGGLRFEDITDRAGVGLSDRYSSGTTMADVDGDGDLDLMVTALGGPNALLLNDGTGTFTDFTQEAGLASDYAGMTIALADIDGDADLDVYVANYKVESAADVLLPFERMDAQMVEQVGETIVVTPEYSSHFRMETLYGRETAVEQAEPDWLYLNDGSGRFTAVDWTDGRFLDREGAPLTQPLDDYAMAARFYDIDGDSDPDLFVAHDFDDPDVLWINDGTGHFRMAAPEAIRNVSHSSMAVDFADVDRNGFVDFFVADMRSLDRSRRLQQQLPLVLAPKTIEQLDDLPQFPRNTFFWNRGDGTFAQISEMVGLDASEWTWTSLFLDVDLDGFEDLLVTNGHGRDWQDGDAMERTSRLRGVIDWKEAKSFYPALSTRNMAFKNGGDLTFEEVGDEWGFSQGGDVSHGMASGDLDGDGDLDLVINRLGSSALVLRNDARAPRVAVRLKGAAPNTVAVGAKVRLLNGAVPVQEKEVTAGGLYLSGADPTLVFAAGSSDADMRLEVEWPGGVFTALEGVRPNRAYELDQPAESNVPRREVFEDPEGARWFSQVETGLDHVEDVFDDFGRQPLLWEEWGRSGPGLAWVDVEGDGDPDLVLPSGGGGRLAVLLNESAGFSDIRRLGDPSGYDQTTIVVAGTGEGGARILVGQSSYQAPAFGPATVRTLGLPRAEGVRPVLEFDGLETETAQEAVGAGRLEGLESSVGPMSVVDVDQDGVLDLFVGGRLLPGRYPESPSSRLFFGGAGSAATDFDAQNVSEFADLGMVSGSVFTDIDADGDSDLLVAVDWGAPRLLINEGGVLSDASAAWGLGELRGRWNGVATGDLNGDGLPDVVLTGWGQNLERRPRPGRPLELVHGDLDQDGRWDVVLSQRAEPGGPLYPLERFERMRGAVPSIRERVESFEAYSEATLAEVLGEDPAGLPRVVADRYDHVVLLNTGGGFEVRPLPAQAQMAPGFGVVVADFDGDGHEDVFMSQNFSPTESMSPRFDGGRGVMLRGDGAGGLEAVNGSETGIAVYGDGRGVAVSDYDADGRVDLAVAQNGGETKVYHNVGGRIGVRVEVEGGVGNPMGLGAMVRLVYGERRGPAREIQGGSGYWSWNDPVQVLGVEEGPEPTGVEVRWPGGRTEVVPLDPGQRTVTVTVQG